MSQYVLGISAFFHDSAAALLRDGEILAAAQEERFTRVKGDPNYPRRAVEFCLAKAGIDAGDVDCVAFYEKPLARFERLVETFVAVAPEGTDAFRSFFPLWARHRLKLPEKLREELGPKFGGELVFPSHHESHAASAFFPSPYEEAAILTLDAVGEWGCSSLGQGRGNRIDLSHELRFPHSLGMLYSAFTYYTGFKVNSGEYKMMGLAPYGRPLYADRILEKVAELRDDGSLWLDMSYFDYCRGTTMTSEKFHELFGGPPRASEAQISQRDMDLAASIQVVCEQAVMRAARHLHAASGGCENLVMAGGVALNCVANGVLLREGPFERLWIQPASGDSGGALGAALLAWHHHLDQPRVVNPNDAQNGSRLGPRFEDDEIRVFLDSVGACYEHHPDEDALLDHVGSLLAEEKIAGWLSGPMEFGPRALGARSILGDPRSTSMQQTMNLKIKFRESFRPFAPSVLREHAPELFELDPEHESPYMLIVAPVREEIHAQLSDEERARMEDPDLRVRVSVPRSTLPSITHVDYSARIQTVDEERHDRYYRLIKKFHELTGCPVLVNTSFNIRGEPIVCTPEDAFHCFMATDMDVLVLENFVLLKSEQPAGLADDAEAYKARFTLD
jgi:carbamoyltransferase